MAGRPRTRIRKAGIYKIISPGGSVYIGQSHCIYKRLETISSNKVRSCNNKLRASIFKYGWGNHIKEIAHELPQDVSQEVLDTYEKLYIQCYKDCGVELLNIKDGGIFATQVQETKEKIREASKRQWVELKKNGLYKLWKYPPRTEETTEKIRKAKEGRIYIGRNKKVICSKTATIYGSAKEAAQSIAIKAVTLRAQLTGKNPNKTTLNYVK